MDIPSRETPTVNIPNRFSSEIQIQTNSAPWVGLTATVQNKLI